MFATFENGKVARISDEYSDINIEFHQTIIRLQPQRAADLTFAENLFTHMRMIL